MADPDSLFDRIDAVEARLRLLAPTARGVTSADPKTGDQWEAGQVWGHMAEFVQFWQEQAGEVIEAYKGEPVPFGRLIDDPTRMAGVDQGLHTDIETLSQAVEAELTDLRRFLNAAPDGWAESIGLHPTRGLVPAGRIMSDYVVKHLEEHASQLENLTGALENFED